MKIINWLKSILCNKCEKVSKLESEANANSIEKQGLKEEIVKLNAKVSELTEKSKIEIPSIILILSESIKKEYPTTEIVYKGYNIRLKNSTANPEIKVQDFIQPIHSHRVWLESKGLILKKYLINNPALNFGEVMNKLMFDFYKNYVSIKSYEYDLVLYGLNEQWAPELDCWYLKKMDCENSTNELMALFESAGLNNELRSFYWNVCGSCPLGGHSTLYAYDFKNNSWRHMETTVTSTSHTNFYELPTNKDLNDSLNITDVWWSFNSEIARHTFKTDTAKESYINRERFRNIIIK